MVERFQRFIGFWYNLHPMLRLLISIVVLLLGAWKVGLPAFRQGKVWWRGRQLAQAERAIQEGNMEEAKNLSTAVLGVEKRKIEALRILEKAMTALKDPYTARVGMSLVFHPEASAEDRRRGFTLMLEDSPLGRVGMAWASLPKDAHTDKSSALPFCDRLLRHNKLQQVIDVVSQFQDWENDWQLLRRAIQAHIANNTTDSFRKAQTSIEARWPADDQETGLELLESIPVLQLNPDLLPKSLQRLKSSMPREAIMLARMQYAQEKWTRLEIVNEVIRQWKEVVPMDVAKFLKATEMHYKLLECFPPAIAAKHDGMTLLLLDACVAEKEWAKALGYLQTSAHQFSSLALLGWKSAIYEKLQMKEELDKILIDITRELSTKSGAKLNLELSEVMKRADHPKMQYQYLLDAIRMEDAPLPLFADLTPLMDYLYAQGLESSMIEVISKFMQFELGNPIITIHFTYFSCITRNCDPALLLKTIQPLSDAYSDNPQLSAVITAIYLAMGDFDEAKKKADQIKFNLAELPPGYEAAVVIARLKSERIEADDTSITKLRWKLMLPIENDFYRSFFDREKVDRK